MRIFFHLLTVVKQGNNYCIYLYDINFIENAKHYCENRNFYSTNVSFVNCNICYVTAIYLFQ